MPCPCARAAGKLPSPSLGKSENREIGKSFEKLHFDARLPIAWHVASCEHQWHSKLVTSAFVTHAAQPSGVRSAQEVRPDFTTAGSSVPASTAAMDSGAVREAGRGLAALCADCSSLAPAEVYGRRC